MRRTATSIRSRIFLSIACILLLSFALVGVVFNIIANQFIKTSAIEQLEHSVNNFSDGYNLINPIITDNIDIVIKNPRINLFRMISNTFIIDADYNYLQKYDETTTHDDIIQVLKTSGLNLKKINELNLRTDTGAYYVTVVYYPNLMVGMDAYVAHYVDATGLTNFSNQVNAILLMISLITCIIAGFFSIFLSGSIARPIKMLSNYAIKIGQGDFSQSGFIFADEELEGLNKNLNQAAMQLKLYDGEQKTFFQNASHELRTPLMSIKCYAEGIQYGLMQPVKASKTIIAETDRLTEMVEDLLYISKIDNITSDYKTEKTDLRELVRLCSEQQTAVAELKNVSFAYDFDENDVFCICAPKLMSKAVTNLISNAIRYAKTTVVLSCKISGGKALISIADDGNGIEPEALPHIFERFYKGKQGNHGIGLSIAKSVVTQHGGKLTAQNAKQGALFAIELPGLPQTIPRRQKNDSGI